MHILLGTAPLEQAMLTAQDFVAVMLHKALTLKPQATLCGIRCSFTLHFKTIRHKTSETRLAGDAGG